MKKSLLTAALLAVSLFGAEKAATVKEVHGSAVAIQNGVETALRPAEELSSDTTIRTKEDGQVIIVFTDNSVMNIAPSSIVKLQKYLFKPQKHEYAFELYMKKGKCAFESGKIGELAPKKFVFKTPEGAVAIRGTKFLVKVQ